jgi:DNA-binding LytR/AlgR family response regulator
MARRTRQTRRLPAREGVVLKVSVNLIDRDREERAIVQCHEVRDDVRSIVRFIKSCGDTVPGYVDERIHQVPLQDVLFVEAVDDRVFASTAKQVYELKCKLYEFEAQHEEQKFFRCSMSFVINLMKVDSVRPILNGRLSAVMKNGEEVVISRQYVPELKKRLLGESR